MYENNMYNKEMTIREGDKIYFKKYPAIIVGMRQANGKKIKNLEKKYGTIEKIERPFLYNRIYENKEILDDVEKRYLKAVIRPFKSKIKSIEKQRSEFERKEYIRVNMNELDVMYFPNFEKGTMYKGMESDKEYTIKELGLYE